MKALIQRLADAAAVTPAKAADDIDKLIYKIVKGLKEGEPVHLPGFGIFAVSGEPTAGTKGERQYCDCERTTHTKC